MKYSFFIMISVLVCCTPISALGEQYLCVGEQATGFAYNDLSKSWKTTDFKNEHKYIVSSKDGKTYTVTRIGDSAHLISGQMNEYGFLRAQDYLGHFEFVKDNLRFLRTYVGGYVYVGKADPEHEKGNTPFIEIGKCSPF